jgi:hypothetical protein
MTLVIVSEDIETNHTKESGIYEVELEKFGVKAPVANVLEVTEKFINNDRAFVMQTGGMSQIQVVVFDSPTRVRQIASTLRAHLETVFAPRYTGPKRTGDDAFDYVRRAEDHCDM